MRDVKVLSSLIAGAMLLVGCMATTKSTSPQSDLVKSDAVLQDAADAEWTVLLDQDKMGDWDRLGTSNWRVEDGVVVVDDKTGKAPGFLVSRDSYKDFVLYIEFWASSDSNSGIFFRCLNPEAIDDRSCYEANIYDQRGDPTYGTGAIVRHSEVDPMPKAGDKWNTYEITAKGRDITLVLNGEKTATLRSGLLTEGPFAIQHGWGTIKVRKVMIKPL